MRQPFRMLDVKGSAADRPDATELHDVVRRWRSDSPAPANAHADLSNVVPFQRARRDGRAAPPAPAIVADPALRPNSVAESRKRWAIFLATSLAAHVALYLPFGREPSPMSSIGLETISVDIVLGANQDAGLNSPRRGSLLNLPPPSQAHEVAEQPKELQEPPTDVATPERPRDVPDEKPPETQVSEAKVEPKQVEASEDPAKNTDDAPAPKPVAPIEPRQEAQQPAPIQAAPQADAPGELQASANPTVVQVETIEAPASPPPKETAVREPPKRESRREAEQRRKQTQREAREARRAAVRGERNESTSTAPAETAAGGVGRGRSDSNTNYRGLVASHLARHKQFPADARSRGAQGRSTVSFTLSGAGSVTSVRLVSGTGVPSLDQETVAMVRRASPFPAPPDGRSVSFTVPVNFQLR